MLVDLEQRHLLANAVGVAIVGVDVDRALEQERLVEPVQFLLQLLPGLLGTLEVRLDRGLALLPHLQDGLLQQAHVARSRLQPREFFDEQTFELGLRDVDAPAPGTAVVVGVVVAPSLRPTAREAAIASGAPHEPAEWEVGPASLQRSGDRHSTGQHSLGFVEHLVADQRLEVPALVPHAEIRHVNHADVQPIAQQHADRLGAERLSSAIGHPPACRQLQHLLLGEPSGCVLLEYPAYQPLQFGPVCRLRALAFFLEALDDLEALAVAVRFAGTELGWQAQVFSLLFGLPAVARSQWLQNERRLVLTRM